MARGQYWIHPALAEVIRERAIGDCRTDVVPVRICDVLPAAAALLGVLGRGYARVWPSDRRGAPGRGVLVDGWLATATRIGDRRTAARVRCWPAARPVRRLACTTSTRPPLVVVGPGCTGAKHGVLCCTVRFQGRGGGGGGVYDESQPHLWRDDPTAANGRKYQRGRADCSGRCQRRRAAAPLSAADLTEPHTWCGIHATIQDGRLYAER